MRQEVDAKVLELTTIYEVSKVLTSTLNIEKSLNTAMNILDKFLGMKCGTVVLSDAETGALFTFVALGRKEEEELKTYKAGEGIIGKVFKSGTPMIIPDIRDEAGLGDQINLPGNGKKVSFICIPVKSSSRVIGTLSVAFYEGNVSFSVDGGVRTLTIAASLIGKAVELNRTLDRERGKLLEENRCLQSEVGIRDSLENMVGKSDRMREIFETVHRVAPTKATVFLRGESGTGKELIARGIHCNSPRAKMPFIKINCTALPETLLESELFGHEKGAFTGATNERKGRFELTDGGTIFLDEIGDILISTQMKLLRVLQEKKFERLGSSKIISVDVRIIAATNQDLEKAVNEGSFREDLYYRLNVIPIFIPPLRERKKDIPHLVKYFLQKFNRENKKRVRISGETIDLMLEYSWPGNVRQLENCIERLVIMVDEELIRTDDLPFEIRAFGNESIDQPDALVRAKKVKSSSSSSLVRTVEDLERERIIEALQKCGWVKSRAASLLEISPRQIDYRINKYQIKLRKPWQEF